MDVCHEDGRQPRVEPLVAADVTEPTGEGVTQVTLFLLEGAVFLQRVVDEKPRRRRVRHEHELHVRPALPIVQPQ